MLGDNMKMLIYAIAAVLLLGFGCIAQEGGQLQGDMEEKTSPQMNGETQGEIEEPKAMMDDEKMMGENAMMGNIYTPEDIAKHNTKEDCWISVNGEVYDVTDAIDAHPGGADAIIRNCGQDATDGFISRPNGPKTDHPQSAYEWLDTMYIGDYEN